LRRVGKKRFSERIEQVSSTKGDGLGFGILSFDESGEERFIEVKTTGFAREMPFYASKSEVVFSGELQEKFHLYRLFEFRKSPRLFSLAGSITNYCKLEPVSYICRV
jgi:Protein NO VEIN, C-terminal